MKNKEDWKTTIYFYLRPTLIYQCYPIILQMRHFMMLPDHITHAAFYGVTRSYYRCGILWCYPIILQMRHFMVLPDEITDAAFYGVTRSYYWCNIFWCSIGLLMWHFMNCENSLHFVYAPSCLSFFYAPNYINAPPKFIKLNASSCILFFLHIRARDLTENYYKRLLLFFYSFILLLL